MAREKLDRFKDSDYDRLLKDISTPRFKKVFSKSNRDNAISMLMHLAIKKPSLAKHLLTR